MSEIISPVLVTGLGIFGVVLGFFWKVEDVASKDAKRTIADWLNRVQLEYPIGTWPNQFSSLFDRIFGERHFTFRCFFRSSIASLCSVFVITAVWVIFHQQQIRSLDWDHPDFYSVMLPSILILNLFIDYTSLLESRYIIGLMGKTQSKTKSLFLLAVDFFATGILFFLATPFVSVIVGVLVGAQTFEIFFDMIPAFFQNAGFGQIDSCCLPFGIYLYSTYFTSVWVWLYVVSGGFIRLVGLFKWALHYLQWFLDIDGHPIRCIGIVAGLLASIGFWFAEFVVRSI